MACRTFVLGDGSVGIACGPRGKRHACSAPNCTAPSSKQCDYPVKGRKSGTCDKHLCARHAVSVGPNLDYCEPHHRAVALPLP